MDFLCPVHRIRPDVQLDVDQNGPARSSAGPVPLIASDVEPAAPPRSEAVKVRLAPGPTREARNEENETTAEHHVEPGTASRHGLDGKLSSRRALPWRCSLARRVCALG